MITGAVTWSDVAVPGAFVAGALLGAIMAIRVMRYVLEYMRNRDKENP